MFNKNFYPTPKKVIYKMLNGFDITDKVILEPSAGKGDIVDVCKELGAKDIIACEIEPDLQTILQTKCNIIESDFLKLKSEQISHVNYIIMNPPFNNDEQHIIHAFNIAPNGCTIIALCNSETLNNTYSRNRERLVNIIEEYGNKENLGNCFSDGERKTNVWISLVRLKKPINDYKSEFEGFFLEEDEQEKQENGLMSYNLVRDIVNRYIESIKLFDKQIEQGIMMNNLLSLFYTNKIAFTCTEDSKIKLRNDFKKDMQKSAWNYIFKQLNMEKYNTQGLRQDLNKFIEEQSHIPFTMKNVYKMLEIIIGTNSQRMDKALVEVFDKVTQHYHENRYAVEGWKTNSHYLLNEKFILPYMINTDKYHTSKDQVEPNWAGNYEIIQDMIKALCFLTGFDYYKTTPLNDFIRNLNCKFGIWYFWSFFEIKCFKKGTMHFKFQTKETWEKFNKEICRIKGYPLFEYKKENTTEVRNEESINSNEQLVLFNI